MNRRQFLGGTGTVTVLLVGGSVWRATRAIIDDHVMVADSERWFRHSRREIERHRDGPTLVDGDIPSIGRASA